MEMNGKSVYKLHLLLTDLYSKGMFIINVEDTI